MGRQRESVLAWQLLVVVVVGSSDDWPGSVPSWQTGRVAVSCELCSASPLDWTGPPLLFNSPDYQHTLHSPAEGWRGRNIQETPGVNQHSPRNLSAARPPTPPSGPAGASSQWPAATGPASRVSSPGRTATTAVETRTRRQTM